MTDVAIANARLERLVKAVRVINILTKRRDASGDVHLGSSMERTIISQELDELEKDIYDDPGALAPYL